MNELQWRKSSHSDPALSDCVEVAETPDGGMAVRDSKQNGQADQTILVFGRSEWAAFIGGAKDGEFD